MSAQSRISASERRGVLVLALIVVVSASIFTLCESGLIYDPVVMTEDANRLNNDTLNNQSETEVQPGKKSDKMKKRHRKSRNKKIKKVYRSRRPLDEPITQ